MSAADSRPDLSAVIVNYNSASLARELVHSLRAEMFEGRDGSEGQLEIIVVENASPQDEKAALLALRDEGVEVVFSTQNRGYAGGCNLGFAHARGEHLLIMNPDVLIVPGALDAMLGHLRGHPDVGQVGPRGWFDAYRFFYLPSIEIPTVRGLLRQVRARMSRRRARELSLRRSRSALRVWTATEPLNEEVIAGYGFMMRSALARELGPFDEGYPFYFEDSDLSQRIRMRGQRCVLLPCAEMVHFYNKSAGPVFDEVMRKFAASQCRYFARHHGPEAELLAASVPEFVERFGHSLRGWTFANAIDLGDCHEPLRLELPRPCTRYLAELTLDPMFSLAVGHIGSGSRFEIPEGVWDALEPTRFLVRLIDLERFEVLGTWSFQKTSPIAPVPTYAEFLRIRERERESPSAAG
ncbi:MAG: glycosyltransferase family 2 protein [Planctomycetota bacterium]